MALPASGTILLSTVKAYFGEATPPNTLTSYNRGGSYVPDISQNSNIPTSASAGNPIKLSQFRGSSDPETVTYTAGSANNVVTPQYQTTAAFKIWGAGGGGGQGNIGYGGGGGGGGFLIKTLSITGGTTTFDYVVGSGGPGASTAGTAGTTGGLSRVVINATTYQANGGIGGGILNGSSGGTTSGNGDAGSESGGSGGNAGSGGGNAGGQSYGGGQGGSTPGVTSPTVPGGGGDGADTFTFGGGQTGADGSIIIEYS